MEIKNSHRLIMDFCGVYDCRNLSPCMHNSRDSEERRNDANLQLLRLKPRQKPRRHLHRVTRSSPRLRPHGVFFLPQGDMFPTVPTRTFHSDLGDKMRKIEAWHGFLETMNSWLALQDKAYVNEIRLCISVKDEIRQDLLPPDTAARSAKLFEFGKVGAWLNGPSPLQRRGSSRGASRGASRGLQGSPLKGPP